VENFAEPVNNNCGLLRLWIGAGGKSLGVRGICGG
jgi:hypothetical protein